MIDMEGRGANEARGELTLMLDGATYVLRPSYEAIEAFEVATGKGLLDLTRSALSGGLTLSETAIITCECIRAYGRSANIVNIAGAKAVRVGEMILESDSGLQGAMVTIATLLTLAATGGVTASGERKAATTMMMEDPSAAA